MYRITEWRNGWLYIQSNPRSDFYRATESQMIEHLLEENQRLKDMIGAIRDMVETVS